MSKVWRTLTVLVAVGAVLGVMMAAVIPSLLRARVSTGGRSNPYPYVMPAPLAPPATMPAFARAYEADPAPMIGTGLPERPGNDATSSRWS